MAASSVTCSNFSSIVFERSVSLIGNVFAKIAQQEVAERILQKEIEERILQKEMEERDHSDPQPVSLSIAICVTCWFPHSVTKEVVV